MNTFIRGLKCLAPYFWWSCSPAAGDAFEIVTGGQWTLSAPVGAEQLVTASREHRLIEEKKPPQAQGARAGFCHHFSLFLLLSLETANLGARTLQWLGSLGSPSVRSAGWNCSEHCLTSKGSRAWTGVSLGWIQAVEVHFLARWHTALFSQVMPWCGCSHPDLQQAPGLVGCCWRF